MDTGTGNGQAPASAGAVRGRNWLLALFGLPFAAVGIGLLGWQVVPTLRDWQAMQDWVPVEAQVLDAELIVHSDGDSATYEAAARYRYRYAGQTHENDRVAVHGGADNIGDFQQQLGARLVQAQQREEPVTVYVNPGDPTQAVVSRELRTGFVVFMSAFSLVFAAVGIGLVVAGLFAKRGGGTHNATADAQTTAQPWRERQEWASSVIESDTKRGAIGAWFFAIFWCAVCAPASMVIPDELAKGNWPILLILLFDVIGIGLLAWAVRETWSSRKFGSVPLHMDPHPGAIGGDVAGYIDIPVAHDPAQLFDVSLTCRRTWVTGSGKNRSTHHDVKWHDEKHLQAEAFDSNHVRLWFRFEPPAGLPASQPPSSDYHGWTLRLAAELPGLDLSRSYELPVFPTAARSAQRIDTRVKASAAPDLAAIEQLTNFRQVPGGAAMDFRAGRDWATGLMVLVLFGGSFGGFGLFMLLGDADLLAKFLFGGIFTLIGALCVAIGLWLVGNRLYAESNDLGIGVRRWLFGIPVWQRDIGRADIEGIAIARGSTTTTPTRTTVHYDLVVKLRDGSQHVIGNGFRGVTQARQAAETFALYARMPYVGEVDGAAAFAARKAAYLAKRMGKD